MHISKTLKHSYPAAFEDFRQWLKHNYEFWQEPVTDPSNVLWFCERQLEGQIGYYLKYLHEKGARLQKFHPLLTPPAGEDSTNPLWIIQEYIEFSFKQMEYHHNTYFNEQDNTENASGGITDTSTDGLL